MNTHINFSCSICTVLCLIISPAALATTAAQTLDSKETGKALKLTPIGAQQSGNADGSIPAWSGGILTVPKNYKTGDFHPDPFAEDVPIYTVTEENFDQYGHLLSDGQKAMFDTYPATFAMMVYPTRRSASYPENIYQWSKQNDANAELLPDGNGIRGAAIGVPFPTPENGLEAIWNHIVRFRGENVKRSGTMAIPTESGQYTMIQTQEQVKFIYAQNDASPEQLTDQNILFKFKQDVIQPARLAGSSLLVHETLDQTYEPRQSWSYEPGKRRVKREPSVAYDTPGRMSDGLRTSDDFDMYNGAPNKFQWTLKGKKEMLIPYNSYKLHSDKLSDEDILFIGHINPELVRYEKHRVWVVEANLKPEYYHTYSKRVYYLDEDSWQIVVADLYDDSETLFRVAMAHSINYYEVPTVWTTLDVFHDLNARRYVAVGLDNQEQVCDFSVTLDDRTFVPNALRIEGRR
ncbi:DUF1329 domain-containing protein [Corallincola luteus]|uniref:DUF1329 domain-containing protein n=1 Tax=Corallincola luteus TaxID=1775177 RepID=A0ABY2AK36_9GAMM|nr:DUF1329 domain-containing protein [Corallincola luteus]TCI01781.1 DUF1329 domain-containing protein [Corallincola luteus]